jgi:hypothetical protein
MVMGFIDSGGNYYEGMKAHKSHIEVPERPSMYHNWDGKDWIEDTATMQAEKDLTDLEEMIKIELREIALASLREKGKI